MIWQDVVLTVLQFGLSAALVPALLSYPKPDRLTCGLNTVLLYAMAVVFVTLDLFLFTATTALVATCWLTLLIQQRRQ